MVYYKLNFTVPSPGNSPTFAEFSPNGRFLVVGDSSSLFLLDKLAGFHPGISTTTPVKPTSLVWETSKAFYVGLGNGDFIHYQIDVGRKKLVKGTVNSFFHGVFPVTAIALDAESKTLVLSVGPDVFAFRRTRATSEFHFVANISSRFNFESDPGIPSPPFPRSICFTPNNTLIIAFCRRNIASIVLKFHGDSHLHSMFQTAKIDYTGLPLLKAITSESEDEIIRLTRFWVHGGTSEADVDAYPFLFINEGVATLSGSALGFAAVKDTVTQREIQMLVHTVADRQISVMAYHVSNERYSIATLDHGANATVKIWTAQRPFRPRSQPRRRSLLRKWWAIATLVVALVVAKLSQMEKFPTIKEIKQFCLQTALIFAHICIAVGYLILEVVQRATVEVQDVLD